MADVDNDWVKAQVGKSLVGRYRLEQVLGVGGMGAVYRGTHVAVGRRVAIKLLLPSAAADTLVAKRFHSEARSAAAVARRGVVDVLDFDVDPDVGPFLVMEYLYGESLGRHIERLGRLSVDETVWIAASILRTLGAVHERGIVHRDLKPDNVFLSRAEDEEEVTVKLVDFGISRVTDPERRTAQLTAPGSVIGTPVYMSPEQARGDPAVDHRTDIYAVGAIVYECLSGRPPYVGDSWQQVFASVLTRPPEPLAQHRPDVPEALTGIVETAMGREPGDRFQSAQAMASALETFRGVPPVTRQVDLGMVELATAPTLASDEVPFGGAQPTPRSSTGRGTVLLLAAFATMLILALGTMGTFVYLAWDHGKGTQATARAAVLADAGAVIAPAPPPAPAATPDARPTAPDAPNVEAPTPTPERTAGRVGHKPNRNTRPSRPTRPTEPNPPEAFLPDSPPTVPTPPTVPATDDDDPVLRTAAATLGRKLEQADAARRTGKSRRARELYEEVISMAFRANLPIASPAGRHAAKARMALGDMAASGIRPRGRASTTEEANQNFQRIIGSYSRAAQQYGKVAEYGHMDLTQCGLVRSARASEKLHGVVKEIKAPEDLVALGGETATRYETSFQQSAESYLETALSLYDAARRMPGGNMGCETEARASLMRVLKILGRPTP